MTKEEALDILKEFHDKSALFSVRTALEVFFPKFKESEDERIRKSLIKYFKNFETESLCTVGLDREDIVSWLEKQGKCESDCPQNHQDVNHPNGCITMEDFNGGEGFYKLNIEYLNKRQVEEIEEIVRTWNKDVDCGLCTSKDYCISIEKQGEMDIEKPITIGKCKLTGKAAELAKEVTPESLEEAKKKLIAEEKLNRRLNQEIQGWYENSEHMDSLWCTVKDAIELTARHFFELGLEHKQKVWTEEDERLLGDVITACYKYYGGFIPWPEIKKWLKSIKGKLS